MYVNEFYKTVLIGNINITYLVAVVINEQRNYYLLGHIITECLPNELGVGKESNITFLSFEMRDIMSSF